AQPHEPGAVPVDERAEGDVVARPEPGHEDVVVVHVERGVEGGPHDRGFRPGRLGPLRIRTIPGKPRRAPAPPQKIPPPAAGDRKKPPPRSVLPSLPRFTAHSPGRMAERERKALHVHLARRPAPPPAAPARAPPSASTPASSSRPG